MFTHPARIVLAAIFVGAFALTAIVEADTQQVAGGPGPGAAPGTPSVPHPAISIRTALSDSAHATPADTSAPVLLPDRVAVLYFHATTRCHGCLWIEATADSTVHTAFAPALEEGRLEWRSINLEEPESQALVQQLEIEGSTLVVAQLAGGKIVRSIHVDQAWYMVDKPKELFDHLRGRVAEYLGEKATKSEAR